MEEKPLTNAQIQKATSRRSRKDEQGRDYQCGCGKRYLSYPALYTHIKTKHDGRQPEGTQKTGAATTIAKRAKGKIQQQTLRHIKSLIDRQDFKLLTLLDDGHLGSVSLSSRIKKQSVCKQIYDCYSNIMKHQQCKLTKNSSLELALLVYLLNAGDYVNDKIYEYYLFFAKIARSCYQQHGNQIYKACFSKKDNGTGYLATFQDTQVQYFPIISDFLIRYYIQETEHNKETKQLIISLIQLITYDFCAWLYRQKLTRIKVGLMKEYKLDIKPIISSKIKSTPKKDETFKEIQPKSNSSNSQEIKKENDDQSDQISEGDQILQQQIQADEVEDKKGQSGSKEDNQSVNN